MTSIAQTTPAAMVSCTAPDGTVHQIPIADLTVRPPAVYAKIGSNGHVLTIVPNGLTRFAFPGGEIAPGESPEESLLRQVKEQTGLDVRVNSLIGVEHGRLCDDRGLNAAQVTALFYACYVPAAPFGRTPRLSGNRGYSPYWASLTEIQQRGFVPPVFSDFAAANFFKPPRPP